MFFEAVVEEIAGQFYILLAVFFDQVHPSFLEPLECHESVGGFFCVEGRFAHRIEAYAIAQALVDLAEDVEGI